MKKFLSLILLIALCCASIFAADVSAKVKLYLSFGDEGISFTHHKGLWEPSFSLSVSSDDAGATLLITPVDFGKKIGLETQIWFTDDLDLRYEAYKEGETVKDKFTYGDDKVWIFRFGSRSYVSFNGASDITAYAEAEYNKGRENYEVILGFKPEQENSGKSSLLIGAQVNHDYKTINTIHFDLISKIDIVNKKPTVNYALGELDWSFGGEDYKLIDKKAFVDYFQGDENYYFSRRDFSWASTTGSDMIVITTQINNPTLTLGARYKYYSEEPEKTGVYAYALASNYVVPEADAEVYKKYKTARDYVEGEIEVGTKGAVLEVSARGAKDGQISDDEYKNPIYGMSYVKAEFNYGKDKASARVAEAYTKLSSTLEDGKAPYTEIHYLAKGAYSTQTEPGLFIKQGVNFSAGICALEPSVILGIDTNNKFKWKTSMEATVNY